MKTQKFLNVWLGIWLVGYCSSLAIADNGAGPSIVIDVAQPGHTVSPLLFGDQVQWPYFGQDFLKVDSFTPSSGQLRTELLDHLKPLHLTVMRYPGGTLASYFHWNVSTGAYSSRSALPTNDLQAGSTFQLQTQVPYFGADEFAQAAQYLGTEMMIQVNVVSGSAAEAAAWLSHYKSMGVTPKYWELGNEEYLYGGNFDAVHLTSAQYAVKYDAIAAALRAVDSSIQVGMVGTNNPGAPGLSDWDQVVMTSVSQKIDFIAVHNCYAPFDSSTSEAPGIYQATLAAPLGIQTNMDLIKADISNFAKPESQGMKIAVTEHASFFLSPNGSDQTANLNAVRRNQSLGSALFSALTFNVFFRNTQIQIAEHINPDSSVWQAPLTVAVANLPGLPGFDMTKPLYPLNYDPMPVQSAYFYMFQLYSDAAGGTTVPATVSGSPTFDSPAVGLVPAYTGVASLDATAVQMTSSPGHLYVYVVNRDLTRDITASMQLRGLSQTVITVSGEQVNGSDYTSKNSLASPGIVQVTSFSAQPLSTFSYTFPAHSLTRLTIDQGKAVQDLQQVGIFPNPLRPALGQTQINFTQLPVGAQLRVYTLSGEKIRELAVDVSGASFWDGRNQSGQKAASGVYLVQIQGAGDKKIFKVGIQR